MLQWLSWGAWLAAGYLWPGGGVWSGGGVQRRRGCEGKAGARQAVLRGELLAGMLVRGGGGRGSAAGNMLTLRSSCETRPGWCRGPGWLVERCARPGARASRYKQHVYRTYAGMEWCDDAGVLAGCRQRWRAPGVGDLEHADSSGLESRPVQARPLPEACSGM
jgi:hypothetical protein